MQNTEILSKPINYFLSIMCQLTDNSSEAEYKTSRLRACSTELFGLECLEREITYYSHALKIMSFYVKDNGSRFHGL